MSYLFSSRKSRRILALLGDYDTHASDMQPTLDSFLAAGRPMANQALTGNKQCDTRRLSLLMIVALESRYHSGLQFRPEEVPKCTKKSVYTGWMLFRGLNGRSRGRVPMQPSPRSLERRGQSSKEFAAPAEAPTQHNQSTKWMFETAPPLLHGQTTSPARLEPRIRGHAVMRRRRRGGGSQLSLHHVGHAILRCFQ